MPTCIIEGREAEFKEGENLVEVAERVGVEIPVFCYHPGLTVVAQCRMCIVEIEKMPKLQAACATPPRDGMVVHVNSEKAVKNREAVMEFLLQNHPLDCPICDKSGECDLQEFSYGYGSAYQRSTERRRTYVDLDMGPVIQKNMNRCIHCTRCIRFGDEIAEIREMVALQRGNNTEITTIDGRPLETDYAGNYADVCPTGSLTIKDFRFHKRVWMLKKTSTVCEGCSRGCNMEIHQDADIIYRCVPRTNLDVNRYWMCDEGRFNFNYIHHPERILEPALKSGSEFEISDWNAALSKLKSLTNGKKVAVLVGSDLTQEEFELIEKFNSKEWKAEIQHFGTEGVRTKKEDGSADQILKMKSRTSNLNGADKMGWKAYSSAPKADVVLVFRGGRAELPDFGGASKIGIGCFTKSEAKGFEVVLPAPTFAEKSGTVYNFEDREQQLVQAIQAPRNVLPLSEIFMRFKNGGKAEGAL